MEPYILITYLNDFVFCPVSIYFHQMFGRITPVLYQDISQIEGKQAHETIENVCYSSRKEVFQGISVYSEEYKLCGKIDIFDADKGLLTERKKHITRIYDGYIFQLYAQYFCLTEMGYAVHRMRFYSSSDNKVFPVKIPHEDKQMLERFEKTIQEINTFDMDKFQQTNRSKCEKCIYETCCDRSLL